MDLLCLVDSSAIVQKGCQLVYQHSDYDVFCFLLLCVMLWWLWKINRKENLLGQKYAWRHSRARKYIGLGLSFGRKYSLCLFMLLLRWHVSFYGPIRAQRNCCIVTAVYWAWSEPVVWAYQPGLNHGLQARTLNLG